MPTLCLFTGIQTTHFLGVRNYRNRSKDFFVLLWTNHSGIAWNLTYIHTFIHTYIRPYTYMHACIHTYMHTCMHNTYIHAYIHTYIHAYIHTYIHTYTHTYIRTRTYIPWIHMRVIKIVECGTSHKYKKYTNLECKILQTLYKNSTLNHLYTKKLSTQYKQCVCKYFLKVAWNFALSFITKLGGKNVENFYTSIECTFFKKQAKLAFGLWR
jgi:hypothetical protein